VHQKILQQSAHGHQKILQQSCSIF
jgi:hypothetical protein